MRKCGAVCGALRPRSVFQICILHALEFQGLTAGEGEEGEITAKSERLSCGGLAYVSGPFRLGRFFFGEVRPHLAITLGNPARTFAKAVHF